MAFEVFEQPWEGLSADIGEAPEAPEFDTEGEELLEGAPTLKVEEPDTEVTYVLFGEEPGFDSVYEQSSDWLEMPGGMLEQFNIYPVNIS